MFDSTQKLNENGFAGSAVDIWWTITSKSALSASNRSNAGQLSQFSADRLNLAKIDSASAGNKSGHSAATSQMKDLATSLDPIVELNGDGEREIGMVAGRTFVGRQGEDSVSEDNHEISQSAQANTTHKFTTSRQHTLLNHKDDDIDSDHETDDGGVTVNVNDSDDDEKADIVYEEETTRNIVKKNKNMPP